MRDALMPALRPLLDTAPSTQAPHAVNGAVVRPIVVAHGEF
jgi:hypothetical protein